MATRSELQAQLTSTNNAIAVLQNQLATVKPGSTDQTQLSIALYNLQQQQQTAQQQLATTTPATPSNPAAYDDQGVLQYGWHINPETGEPYYDGNADVPQPQKDATTQLPAPTSGTTLPTVATSETVTNSDTAAQLAFDPNTNIGNEERATAQAQQLASDPNTNLGTEGQAVSKLQQEPVVADDGTTDGVVAAGALDGRNTDTVADDGTSGAVQEEINRMAAAKARETAGDTPAKFEQKADWRVRLSLAPSAKYFYRVANTGDILYPLRETDGVVFPYTPAVSTTYSANYEPTDITHSNYKLFFYKNSAVDDITITADFTAQDTQEANYLLAVIHFFKTVTKMFYGQDGKKDSPKPGTPPPLCYLSGLGAFQFDNHPLLIKTFTYSLPTDVDYIRAGSTTSWGGAGVGTFANKQNTDKYIPGIGTILGRLQGSKLQFGGKSKDPDFKTLSTQKATYVPTKMQIQISAVPVVSRNDISNTFSLSEYAKGTLTQGSKNNRGGIW